MINGVHTIIYSTDPDADRAFLRDVLQLTNVDVGDGWLIFGLPPAEVAVHPSDKNDGHELYLMCDDVESFIAEMSKHDIACGPVRDEGWGLLTHLTLPGGTQFPVTTKTYVYWKGSGGRGTRLRRRVPCVVRWRSQSRPTHIVTEYSPATQLVFVKETVCAVTQSQWAEPPGWCA